jgi:excisionase family DNA binding protein
MNETGFNGNQLLTYREAAKFLHICERSLWQLVKDGLMPCVRMGRSVRFDVRDLRAYVDQQKERGGVKLATAACAAGV